MDDALSEEELVILAGLAGLMIRRGGASDSEMAALEALGRRVVERGFVERDPYRSAASTIPLTAERWTEIIGQGAGLFDEELRRGALGLDSRDARDHLYGLLLEVATSGAGSEGWAVLNWLREHWEIVER